METYVVRLSKNRWAVVTDYGRHGGAGHRQGCWCEDKAGGWSVHDWDPRQAVDGCVEPVTYKTLFDALCKRPSMIKDVPLGRNAALTRVCSLSSRFTSADRPVYLIDPRYVSVSVCGCGEKASNVEESRDPCIGTDQAVNERRERLLSKSVYRRLSIQRSDD